MTGRGDTETRRHGDTENELPLPLGEGRGEGGLPASPRPSVPASESHHRIAAAAALLMLGSVASRVLGLVREQVMAALFGASGGTDAFVAAYTIPTTLYDLLVGGAISAALVPVLVDVSRQERRFWQVAGALLTLVGLAVAVLAAVLALLAPTVMHLLGQGFTDQRQDLAVLMVRLMLPAVVLQSLSGVAMAVLYARQRFALPAFAAALFNAGIILGALALHTLVGVTALVLGVLLGALFQAGMLIGGMVLIRRAGERGSGGAGESPPLPHSPTPPLQIRPLPPEVRTALLLYLPVAAGMLVTIVGVVIDRNLASRLEEGSMSVMRYATTIVQFPLGLVGIATSLAVLPTLSAHASGFAGGDRGQLDGYRQTLAFGMRLVLLLMLPATVGLMLLREPLVSVLFQRGAFTEYDAFRTSLTFLAYAPQMPFTALDQLLIVAFYARKDTRTPVLVGVATVLLYLVTALALISPWGVVGLATANTVQNTAHGLILLVLLQLAIGGLITSGLLAQVGKMLVAAAAMGAVLVLVLPLGAGFQGLAAQLAFLCAAMALGALVYLGLVELLRVPEGRVLRELMLSRLLRSRT